MNNTRICRILLTGASSGIGKQLLELLCRKGNVKILAIARHTEGLPEHEGKVIPFRADISRYSEIDRIFEYLQSWQGLDLCIANAGFAYCERLGPTADWTHIQQIFDTNSLSQIYMIRKLVELNDRPDGVVPVRFVSTLSAVAMVPLPYYALYCSSKAALDMFFRTYRYEKPSWLRISCVYPVATRTGFFSKASRRSDPPLPLIRQTPEQVARAIFNGIRKGKKRIYPSRLFAIFYPLMRAFPILIRLYSGNEKRKMESYLSRRQNRPES